MMKTTLWHKVPDGYYGKLATQWLNNNTSLSVIYPTSEKDIQEIIGGYSAFSTDQRSILVDCLQNQYGNLIQDMAVAENIEALKSSNTFTVTTGQQIHIFLGPAFVAYKIWSVIRHARRLQSQFPQYRFVPVFWMASEDHDLAEINHVGVFGKSFTWEKEAGGPVGRLSPAGIAEIAQEIEGLIGNGEEAKQLLQVFREAYSKGKTLSEATRIIIDYFFGKEGLVVIDPDDATLKVQLKDLALKDCFSDEIFDTLSTTTQELKKMGHPAQVNPRKTHFFLYENGLRCRIDKADTSFMLHPSDKSIGEAELRGTIRDNPALLSPNALMRPVYQQLILPNVAYVCGPAELHYWHQLYPLFKQANTVAPVLFLRDSFTIVQPKEQEMINDLGINEEEYWLGFEHTANTLDNLLQANHAISDKIIEMQGELEVLYASLYSMKSPNLSEVKKSGDILLNNLRKANNNYLENLRSNPANAHRYSRLNKLSTQLFSIKNPQERRFSLLEYLLKYPDLLNYSSSMESKKHCFGKITV